MYGLISMLPIFAIGDTVTENWLPIVGTVAGGIVAIILIISIVKDTLQYIKGGGTGIGKIIGKAVFLLLMIGLIIFASTYGSVQELGGSLQQSGTGLLNTVVSDIGVAD